MTCSTCKRPLFTNEQRQGECLPCFVRALSNWNRMVNTIVPRWRAWHYERWRV